MNSMCRLKITLTALLLMGLMTLAACKRETPHSDVEATADRISVSLSVDVPHYTPLRALQQNEIDENKITSLELLVFNKDGVMVDYARASELQETTTGHYSFSAQIRPHVEPCVIHFVANRNFGGTDRAQRLIGLKEGDVLLSDLVTMEQVIATKRIPMWARVAYDKIEAGQSLGTIALLRSMAKFTVTNSPDSKLSEVSYTLCNSYDCGSVAPFDASKLPSGGFAEAFTFTAIPTVPREHFASDLGWYSEDVSLYGFERHNKVANPISCLIVRAKYQGVFSYYKLDLVPSRDRLSRYDLLRNHWYKVTLHDALAPGAPTLEAALAGSAVNNLALSEELQVYPSYSDGKGRLEVESSNFMITDGSRNLTFNARYFAQGDTHPNNGKLYIVAVRNSTPHPAIADKDRVTISGNGQVTAQLNTAQPGTRLISDIIIGVKDDPDLMRIVRVEVREPYSYASFKANGIATQENSATTYVLNQQKANLRFEITLPEDFNVTRLPIKLRFFTEQFYPDAANTGNVGHFEFGRKGDRTCYTTIITSLPADRTLTCHFLSNRSDCAETIDVVSVEGLFYPQHITISTE